MRSIAGIGVVALFGHDGFGPDPIYGAG